jgi:hypothetical protein
MLEHALALIDFSTYIVGTVRNFPRIRAQSTQLVLNCTLGKVRDENDHHRSPQPLAFSYLRSALGA